jgi:hypothetical protein
MSGSDDRKMRWSKFFILHPSMSGAYSRENDRIYLVSVGIEWYFTIISNSVPCPMSRLSQFQMTSVEASLLPFAMDFRSLNFGEGITVGAAHTDLGHWLDSNHL